MKCMQRGQNGRRASAPVALGRSSKREAEPSETEKEEDDEDEEDEENGKEEAGANRYPSRRRSQVEHFDPQVIYQAQPRTRPKREVGHFVFDT